MHWDYLPYLRLYLPHSDPSSYLPYSHPPPIHLSFLGLVPASMSLYILGFLLVLSSGLRVLLECREVPAYLLNPILLTGTFLLIPSSPGKSLPVPL